MIELIQSLPSPSLQRGITHSWMRETSVVDGYALVMTMAIILSKFPIQAGYQNGVSGSESWFLVAAAERNSFWKTSPMRGVSGPVPGVGLGPPGLPSVPPSGSVDLLVKYIFWHIFRDFS